MFDREAVFITQKLIPLMEKVRRKPLTFWFMARTTAGRGLELSCSVGRFHARGLLMVTRRRFQMLRCRSKHERHPAQCPALPYPAECAACRVAVLITRFSPTVHGLLLFTVYYFSWFTVMASRVMHAASGLEGCLPHVALHERCNARRLSHISSSLRSPAGPQPQGCHGAYHHQHSRLQDHQDTRLQIETEHDTTVPPYLHAGPQPQGCHGAHHHQGGS